MTARSTRIVVSFNIRLGISPLSSSLTKDANKERLATEVNSYKNRAIIVCEMPLIYRAAEET